MRATAPVTSTTPTNSDLRISASLVPEGVAEVVAAADDEVAEATVEGDDDSDS
jgi:hypothetical protein